MYEINLHQESVANILKRSMTSLVNRIRGWLYLKLGILSGEKGSQLILSSGSKIINGKNILIKGRVKIGKNARLECHAVADVKAIGLIVLNNEVSLGDNVHIGSVSKIELEEGVLAGSNILITDHSHGKPSSIYNEYSTMPKKRPLTSKGNIVVEKNAWICDGVVILSGVIVGCAAILGANVVVRKSVDARSIVT